MDYADRNVMDFKVSIGMYFSSLSDKRVCKTKHRSEVDGSHILKNGPHKNLNELFQVPDVQLIALID